MSVFNKTYKVMKDRQHRSKMLGRGVSSRVFKVCLKSDSSQIFAAKLCRFRNSDERTRLIHEHKLLHRFGGHSLYISHIFENQTNHTLVFIMPLGMHLKAWWQSVDPLFMNESIPKQERIIKKLVYEILLNLAEIHAHHYIHHDIKPQNILVLKNGKRDKEWINNYTFHIIDYGLAIKTQNDSIELAPDELMFGTFGYNAWELMKVHQRRHYDYSIDLFSLAVTICELVIGYNVLRDEQFIAKQEEFCYAQLIDMYEINCEENEQFDGFDDNEIYYETMMLKCAFWIQHFHRRNGISNYNEEESMIRSIMIRALQTNTPYTTRFRNFISNLMRDNTQQRISTVYDAIHHDFFYDV